MMGATRVMDQEWDHLLVLDACRYDYFEEMHGGYLDGTLRLVTSCGSNTAEWRDRNFTGFYPDVVYVSANPYINSKHMVRGGFVGDRFHKVVDVWDSHWNAGLGTVHPSSVNESALRRLRLDPGRRLIVHYLQPHCPYIGAQPRGTGYAPPAPGSRTVLNEMQGSTNAGWLMGLAMSASRTPPFNRLLTESRLWWVGRALRSEPMTPMEAYWRLHGPGGLREAYKRNLALVLGYVSELVSELSGTVVVTSDHGELLGERGRYSHGYGREEPELLTVPWLTLQA
jgi:hypothetical protein